MQKLSLDALARELLTRATGSGTSGSADGARAAQTVVGGHEKALRQTVIALAKDAALAEHASPGEGTLYVLRGRVTLTAGTESWEGRQGDLLVIPDAPHSVTAMADSAVLLTVVKHLLQALPGPQASAPRSSVALPAERKQKSWIRLTAGKRAGSPGSEPDAAVKCAG